MQAGCHVTLCQEQYQVGLCKDACTSRRLFPLATVITPNLSEAAALLGNRKIESIEDMKAAAKDLHALGPQFVLVKGGHLEQGEPVLHHTQPLHCCSTS